MPKTEGSPGARTIEKSAPSLSVIDGYNADDFIDWISTSMPDSARSFLICGASCVTQVWSVVYSVVLIGPLTPASFSSSLAFAVFFV